MLVPAAIILGVIGGMLGAAFININTRAGTVRKKCLKTKWSKVLETGIFAFVSASCIFWIPYFFRERGNFDGCLYKIKGTPKFYTKLCDDTHLISSLYVNS